MNKTFKVEIGNCVRELNLIEGASVSYYSFNMLGDCELNEESAKELAKKIDGSVDVIVTIESKAIALTQELSRLLGHKKYVVIRKSVKSYMRNAVSVSGNTIISGNADYVIDGADVEYLKGKRILVLDDVISTGGTIDAVCKLLGKCGLQPIQFACVLCEGKMTTEFNGAPVVSCGFIPLLEGKDD